MAGGSRGGAGRASQRCCKQLVHTPLLDTPSWRRILRCVEKQTPDQEAQHTQSETAEESSLEWSWPLAKVLQVENSLGLQDDD